MDEEKPKSISWRAPEFTHYPKSPLWYALATTIGLGLGVYFLIKGDIITGLLFVLLLMVVIFFSGQKPKIVEITLDGKGLRMNDFAIPYQQIKNFWIVYNPPDVKTINFETTAYLNRFITVQLSDQNPVAVRGFLAGLIPEDLEREEQLADKLQRKIRF